jgi:hypothetical protein
VLRTGDRLTREEFHRRYEAMPEDFRAELIGGVVHVFARGKVGPGRLRSALGALFALFAAPTPGVEAGGPVTLLLGEDSEPQPDLYLRVLPECAGRSWATADDYLAGPPELIGEVANSRNAAEWQRRLLDYTRCGVQEYLSLHLPDNLLRWFDLRSNQELQADADGVCRLRSFPGLWIHVEALLARDGGRLVSTLEQGLATPEHAGFVRQLAERRTAGGSR